MRLLTSFVLVLCEAAGCGGSGEVGPQTDGAVIDGPPLVVGDAGPGDQPRFVEYIRATPYRRLRLEIDSVPGFEPRSAVESDLIAGLTTLLDKPDGIDAVHDDALPSRGVDHAWSFAELDGLAGDSFDDSAPQGTISMHVMFVDGHYEQDTSTSRILGIAWSHTHLVMFKQTIESSCSGTLVPPLLQEDFCSAAELSIWTHETGHLIGLVDLGLPMVMDHRDPGGHGAHDVNDQCVMYWAYEGTSAVDLLAERFLGGDLSALDFDDACLADVAAIRDL